VKILTSQTFPDHIRYLFEVLNVTNQQVEAKVMKKRITLLVLGIMLVASFTGIFSIKTLGEESHPYKAGI
jgi:hypothetical protein